MRHALILAALALAGCDPATGSPAAKPEGGLLKQHEGKTVYTAPNPHAYWHSRQDCPDLERVRKTEKVSDCAMHKSQAIPCVATCVGRHKESVLAPAVAATVNNGAVVGEKQARLSREHCPGCVK